MQRRGLRQMSKQVIVLPEDEFNRTLIDIVCPPDYINPEPVSQYQEKKMTLFFERIAQAVDG